MGKHFKKNRSSDKGGKTVSNTEKRGSGPNTKKQSGGDRPAKRTGGNFKNDRDAPAKQRDSGKGGRKNDKGKQDGQGAKKNISLAKLREESKTKGHKDGDRKSGKKFARFRKGKHGAKPAAKKSGKDVSDKPKVPRDPKERKEFLDKEIENYWLKGGHTEMIAKRLDQDLEEYWKKTDEEAGEAEAPAIKADEPEKE